MVNVCVTYKPQLVFESHYARPFINKHYERPPGPILKKEHKQSMETINTVFLQDTTWIAQRHW